MGLRGRILIVLFFVFATAFSLLGVAGSILSGRDKSVEQEDSLRDFFALLAASTSLENELDLVNFHRVAVAHPHISGIRTEIRGKDLRESGFVGDGKVMSIALNNRAVLVTLWLADPVRKDSALRLLLFYLLLTAVGILVFAYVAMTAIVIRPLERIRVNAERLARGNLAVKVPVNGARELANLAETFNQMSAQLRIDQELLKNRVVAVQEAKDELEDTQTMLIRSEKLAGVGRLAAGVAHEIGNPLTAVLGMLEILRSGTVDEEKKAKFLERIEKETQRIHHVIRELLDYSRSQNDDEKNATADLVAVIHDAISLLSPQPDLRNVKIEFEPKGTVQVCAAADELRQVFVNLIINAGHAMDGKGLLSIKTSEAAGLVQIRVCDNGPGIPEGLLKQIFEPFVTTKSSGKGTGLGLAVSSSIVERFGGKIHAENTENGACFAITLTSLG